jgi:hypothetical protein
LLSRVVCFALESGPYFFRQLFANAAIAAIA